MDTKDIALLPYDAVAMNEEIENLKFFSLQILMIVGEGSLATGLTAE